MDMMDKYNFFEIMDEYKSEDALIDQICDDQLEQSDIDYIKMRTLQKIGEKKMKKRVNKGLLGVAAAVLLIVVGTGGYCKTNDITFTQLFSGNKGQEVLPTETTEPTEKPISTEIPTETTESTEKADRVKQETETENTETAISQESVKEMTVYFGDKECPMDGNLNENLDIYEENGIIAKIGEKYYLGRNEIEPSDVEGVFENQYNDERGCYEKVMVKKPIYENFPIVGISVGPINEKTKKVVVIYEFSAEQASAMSCFPSWKMETEEDSSGSTVFVEYPKESFVIKSEDYDSEIGCGTIISDGTIVDVSKYEKMQEEQEEQEEYGVYYGWQKEYMGYPDVQLLSDVALEQITKYIDGEIQSLSTVKIWGKGVGNITVNSYSKSDKSLKLYQKILQEQSE